MDDEREKDLTIVERFRKRWENHRILAWVIIFSLFVLNPIMKFDALLSAIENFHRRLFRPEAIPVSPDSLVIKDSPTSEGRDTGDASPGKANSETVKREIELEINNCIYNLDTERMKEILHRLKFSEDVVVFVREDYDIYEEQPNYFDLLITRKKVSIDSLRTDKNGLINIVWLKSTNI
ncbi:MAG: hypothetical protein IPH12_14155 [Saprospirales bacterium]|jgi:hypothetical protein|nr:hypothetical protein [Saprospirales bacterium]MBK8924082.1 hypothetical protein [Saprospirales bacterium]